ncbi:MAG: hypothetical protein MZV70_41585 [Desulfobacterales bacterium]|nr:hypothetical protein [Desulfobacterales bacterium]
MAEKILPPGLHTVEVAVLDHVGQRRAVPARPRARAERLVLRRHRRPDAGRRTTMTNGRGELFVGEDDAVRLRVRRWTAGIGVLRATASSATAGGLTASVDTREGPSSSICSATSSDKSARRAVPPHRPGLLLSDLRRRRHGRGAARRPLGKFYVKLKKDDELRAVGQLQRRLPENDLAHVDRGLYGANAPLPDRSATTSFGEQQLRARRLRAPSRARCRAAQEFPRHRRLALLTCATRTS